MFDPENAAPAHGVLPAGTRAYRKLLPATSRTRKTTLEHILIQASAQLPACPPDGKRQAQRQKKTGQDGYPDRFSVETKAFAPVAGSHWQITTQRVASRCNFAQAALWSPLG